MIHGIKSQADIDALARLWDLNRADPVFTIEALPRLEDAVTGDIEWVVDRLIFAGGVHLLASEPGHGKSTLASSLGYAVSRGLRFLDRSTSARPVLLLDGENHGKVIRERFERLGIMTDALFIVWGSFSGTDPIEHWEQAVLDWVNRCPVRPLIIVDSIAAFFSGSENDANDVRKFMKLLLALAAAGAAVLVLHHTGKSATASVFRGSSDFKASVDVGLHLQAVGSASRLERLTLITFKQRVAVDVPFSLTYSDGEFRVDCDTAPLSTEEQLIKLLQGAPGVTGADFETLAVTAGLGRNAARQFLKTRTEQIEVKPGRNQSKRYTWIGATSEVLAKP